MLSGLVQIAIYSYVAECTVHATIICHLRRRAKIMQSLPAMNDAREKSRGLRSSARSDCTRVAFEVHALFVVTVLKISEGGARLYRQFVKGTQYVPFIRHAPHSPMPLMVRFTSICEDERKASARIPLNQPKFAAYSSSLMGSTAA